MRVIEQLVQHFWTRGALSREDARYLVDHGFVRETDLPGFSDEADESNCVAANGDEQRESRLNQEAVLAEQLEDELTGRNSSGGKKGGKKKPAGHNTAPAAALLSQHLTVREPLPALQELGNRITPCPTWRDAAKAVAAATPAELEIALLGLLNARARSLGELWFWFDLEPLFAWTKHPDNAGPVADALGKLLRTDTPARVGRLDQLKKTPEVQAFTDLLAARRPFLATLPVLYDRYFDKLGQWLVPPVGVASGPWPVLPWAFVIVYNARRGTVDTPPPGYPVDPHQLPFEILRAALTAALTMAPVPVRELLIDRLRSRDEPLPEFLDLVRKAVFDRPLQCPYSWKV
jgi:hypothetical protein